MLPLQDNRFKICLLSVFNVSLSTSDNKCIKFVLRFSDNLKSLSRVCFLALPKALSDNKYRPILYCCYLNFKSWNIVFIFDTFVCKLAGHYLKMAANDGARCAATRERGQDRRLPLVTEWRLPSILCCCSLQARSESISLTTSLQLTSQWDKTRYFILLCNQRKCSQKATGALFHLAHWQKQSYFAAVFTECPHKENVRERCLSAFVFIQICIKQWDT